MSGGYMSGGFESTCQHGGKRVMHKRKAPRGHGGIFESDIDYEGGSIFDEIVSGISNVAQAVGPLASLASKFGAGRLPMHMQHRMHPAHHMMKTHHARGGESLAEQFDELNLDGCGYKKPIKHVKKTRGGAVPAAIKHMTKAQLQRALVKSRA